MPTTKTAIVGAGITGLTAAYHLDRRESQEVVVLEATDRAGGPIRSESEEGFLLEAGPHTILQRNRATAELIDELGLRSAVVETSSEANTRYVVRDGELVAVPMSLSEFLSTELLSTGAKIRLLGEPFVGPREDDIDESLANFVRRRLGEEILDYAVGPMVGGIFAGRPRELSARHAFENMWALEQDHGSLAAGMLHRLTGSDDRGPPRTLLSFEHGSEQLVEALAEAVGDPIRYGQRIVSADRESDGWRVTSAEGREYGPFDDLVWTAPAYELAEVEISGPDGTADLTPLADVYYPPVTVVEMGVDRSRIDHALDGFGCLVPETEPYRILGCLFMSSLFPGRAPAGQVLLSSFVGGSRDAELTTHSREELETIVRHDLRELLGLRAPPSFVHFFEWERAIPQYEVGYGRILEHLEMVEARFRGLHFTGSYRDGIAVPDLIDAGRSTASAIARPRSNETGIGTEP